MIFSLKIPGKRTVRACHIDHIFTNIQSLHPLYPYNRISLTQFTHIRLPRDFSNSSKTLKLTTDLSSAANMAGFRPPELTFCQN